MKNILINLKHVVLFSVLIFFSCNLLSQNVIKFSSIKEKIVFVSNRNREFAAPIIKSGTSFFILAPQNAIWDSEIVRITGYSGQNIPFSSIEIPNDRRGLARIKIEKESSFFSTRQTSGKVPKEALTLISTKPHGTIIFTPAEFKGDKIVFEIKNPNYVPQKKANKETNLEQDLKIQNFSLSDYDFSIVISASGMLLGLISSVGINEGQFLYFEYDDQISWQAVDNKTFFKEGKIISEIKNFIPKYMKVAELFFSQRYKPFELSPNMPEELVNWAISYNEHAKDMPFEKTKVQKGASLEGLSAGDLGVQNKRLEICSRFANFAKTRFSTIQNLKDSNNKFVRNEANRISKELSRVIEQVENEKKPTFKNLFPSDKEKISLNVEPLKPIIDDGKAKLGKINFKGKKEFSKGNHPDWREKGRIYGVSKNKNFTKFKGSVIDSDKKETNSAVAEKQMDGTSAFSLWLPPGKYNILVSATGCEPLELKNLEVKTDNDLVLELDYEKPEEE